MIGWEVLLGLLWRGIESVVKEMNIQQSWIVSLYSKFINDFLLFNVTYICVYMTDKYQINLFVYFILCISWQTKMYSNHYRKQHEITILCHWIFKDKIIHLFLRLDNNKETNNDIHIIFKILAIFVILIFYNTYI